MTRWSAAWVGRLSAMCVHVCAERFWYPYVDNLLGNLDDPAKCFKSGSDNANLSVTVAAVANSLNCRAMVGCVCADEECNKDQGLEDNATDKKNNSSHVTPET